MSKKTLHPLATRFRGFYPVVIDIETAGFEAKTDAVLEIAAVLLTMNDAQELELGERIACHVAPFEGANLDREALQFTGIDPFHPFRFAISEKETLQEILAPVNAMIEKFGCQRAVLVGHNAWFDLGFLKAMAKRAKLGLPFHKFTTFDTATLGGVFYGQTVLAKACHKANIPFDQNEAHSALYDAERTAELFCKIVNSWKL